MPSSDAGYSRAMSGLSRTNGTWPNTVPRATNRMSPSKRRGCVCGDALLFTGGLYASVVQRQRHAAPITRRKVARNQDFEGSQAFAAVGLRLTLPAQCLDHILVIERMPEAVDRSGRVIGRADILVLRAGIGELPLLYLVHSHAANAHRAVLPENRHGTFEVLRIREHGHINGAKRAGTPAHADGRCVFHLDVARQRRDVGLHAFHRAHKPVDQIDIVAGLIHEGATIEFPGTTPAGRVVVLLRAAPEDVNGHHEDPPEAPLLDRSLQQLQGGIATIL